MHLTRSELSKKVPVPRKGTRYIARTLGHVQNSISVLVAVRDMLHLAETAREVQEMIKSKLLKVNGRVVGNYRMPICFPSIIEAHKKYRVSILPTGRFTLVETKESTRFAKVIGKKILNGGILQYNLHDGTNVITKDKLSIGDSVELDMNNKMLKNFPLAKAKKVFIYRGRNLGHEATVEELSGNKIRLKLEGRLLSLNTNQVMVL